MNFATLDFLIFYMFHQIKYIEKRKAGVTAMTPHQ